jgi:trafficking protein particle complex subunit 10
MISIIQLDIIGVEAGHLPRTPPFSTSLSILQPGTKIQFTNETLNTAFSNQKAFYELYIAVTNRAIDFYAKSGRRKFALKLHGTLSALEV